MRLPPGRARIGPGIHTLSPRIQRHQRRRHGEPYGGHARRRRAPGGVRFLRRGLRRTAGSAGEGIRHTQSGFSVCGLKIIRGVLRADDRRAVGNRNSHPARVQRLRAGSAAARRPRARRRTLPAPSFRRRFAGGA